MNRNLKCWLFSGLSVVLSLPGFSQSVGDYRTDQTGQWGAATTWEVFNSGAWQKCENIAAGPFQNITPTSASGAINILNNTTVAASVTADQLTLTAGTLTINAGQTLTIADGTGDDFTNLGGTVTVTGSMAVNANVVYNHARNGGAIPLISWGSNSTCLVTGILNTSPALNAAAAYQFFTWDCAGQSATITLAGNLRSVARDLNITETNDQQLRFATNQAYTLNIGGDFTVDNTSRIAFCTTASPVAINTTGNFTYNSSAAAGSLLKSSGPYVLTVNDFTQTAGLITMGTGGGVGTVNVKGAFDQSAGTINETGAGSGLFVFNGTAGIQSVSSAGMITGTIDFQVNNASVSGGIQLLSDLSLGALTQTAGDIVINSQTLTINGNFSQAGGNIVTDPSAQLILTGAGTLPVGAVSFSGTDLLTLTVDQTGTLTTSSALTITNLNLLNGTLSSNTIAMATDGLIQRDAGAISATPSGTSYDLTYINAGALNTGPEMPASATLLRHLTKQGAGTLTLSQALVTVNGDFTTTTGTFACGANSMSIAGDFNSNATFTTAAGSTITFTGPGNVLQGAVTPSFRGIAVNGNLTPNVNYNVAGNYSVGASGVLNAGTGLVTFNGTTTVTIAAGGTMNLGAATVAAAATLNAPAGTMGIAGNFVINNTSTFTNGGGTIAFNGTTILSGAGAKTFNNVNVTGSISAAGTVAWRIDGTLNNTGTVNFTGSTGNTSFGGTTPALTGAGTIQFGPVVVLAAATLTTSSVFSMTTLNINAGGVLTANADFSMTGNFTGTGNFSSTATVTFAGGTTSMTAAGTKSFHDIVVNNGAIFSPAVAYTVTGSITVNPTGSLADPNNTHTVTFNGSPVTVSGGGSIIFDGVTISAGATLNVTSNVTIDNAFTDGAGSTFSSSGTVTFTGVTMTGTGTKTFTNVTVGTGTFTPNAAYTITGNLIVNGTLAAGNSTTTFNGAGSTISGAGATTFNFLVNSGTLTSSTGTINVVRDLTNNGTFNHNGGTVNFSTTGTVQQQILGSQGITFNNLTVSNVGVATDLTNGNSGVISIVGTLGFGEANAVFDADGAGAGQLVLVSSADSPAIDGRIGTIPAASSNVSGNFTVQRYVSSENRIWRYIASPVVGATVAQLKAVIPVTGTFTDPSDGSSSPPCTGCVTTSPSLYYYDESTQAYVAYPASGLASAAALTNARGYSTFFRHTGLGAVGTVVLSFRGTNPSPAGVNLPVAAAANGYSLIGNPYPSAINWANAAGWSARTNFSNIAVVRDNATGVHQFLDLNSASPQLIAPGQSFWVQTLVAATPLTVNENAKATGSYSFFRLDQPMEDILELNLTKGTTMTTDNARIVIRPNSTELYDAYDQFKFNNNIDNGSTITEVQDISTLTVEATPKALAVNAIPSMGCSRTFSIRVTNFVNTGEGTVNYSLSINPSGAMRSMSWSLHDNYTNSDFNLSTNGTYNFSVNESIAASKASNRFTITATAPSVDTNKTLTAAPMTCGGSDALVTLAASQAGIAYGVEVNGQYYPNVASGTGLDLSLFIDKDKLQAGTNTIIVKASSGCQVTTIGNPVQIEVAPIFTAAATAPPAQCAEGTFAFTASGAPTDGDYHWYDSPASGVVLATGPTFSTTVSATRSYFVSAVNAAGCEGQRTEVVATIADTTAVNVDVVQSAAAVCKGSAMSFTASASDGQGQFLWYDTTDPAAAPLATLNSGQPFTRTLNSNKDYYVRYSPAAGCISQARTVHGATYTFNYALSAASMASAVCEGQKNTLTASGAPAGSIYKWFSGDGVQLLNEGARYETTALAAGTTFQVIAYDDAGCATTALTYAPSIVAVPGTPAITVSYGNSTVCQDTETELTISNPSSGLTYRWYESTAAVEPIHEGVVLPSRSYPSDQSFYVGAVNSQGCETPAASRKKVDVHVTNFDEPVIDTPAYGVLKSSYSQGNQWFVNGEQISGQVDQTLRVFDPGYYSVKVSYQGCEASSNIIFTTDLITGLEDASRIIRLYPNPVSEKLTVHALGNDPVNGQLLDIQGRPVVSIQMFPGDGEWFGELDVRSFASGIYLLRLSSGAKSVTHKVIIR